MSDRSSSLLVLGGGIAGLAAAWEASRAGEHRVTVVEAEHRLGGRILTSELDGLRIDEAADAFLARVPWGLELCRELGLEDELVSPAARTAFIWSHGGLRPLPDAHVLGVPLDLDDLERTGLVSAEGLAEAQAAIERAGPETGDDTIADVLHRQVGAEVAERLVDPLVGGINAGDTSRLSLRAVVPQLADAARHEDGLVAGLRELRAAHPPDPDAPVFHGFPGGTDRLIDALAAALADAGVETLTGTPARRVRRDADGRIEVAVGGRSEPLVADRIVLATPAPVTARLVKGAAPDVAEALATIDHASVALITMVCDRDSVDHDLDGSGFLVPRAEGLDITACSWASSKWAHLGRDDRVVFRTSIGRAGADELLKEPDDALAAAAGLDLSVTSGLTGPPRAVRVSRWHRSFPQYAPGHLDLVDRVETDLAEALPGAAVAGSAYRGVGIPACIHSGRQAARALLD